MVSYNRVLEELDPNDTVTHAVNAMPGSLAFTATKKSVNRFLTMDLKPARLMSPRAYLEIRIENASCCRIRGRMS